jgi:hypothetical protein
MPDLQLDGVEIMFRNFAGVKKQFNDEGKRNFCIRLEPDVAEQLRRDGWNIKTLRPRDPEDEPQPYLQVAVSYKIRPPRVVLLSSRGRTPLPEELVELADVVELDWADVIVRPSRWEMNGNSGIKAYLQTIYLKVREDALEQRYADVPLADGAREHLAIDAAPHYDYEGEVVETPLEIEAR